MRVPSQSKDTFNGTDFSDTLIARQKKQSYRTSRQEVTSRTETLEEKITRVRREMEEIRMEMVQENKPDTEIQEWEGIIHSHVDDHIATKLLTTRIQKLVSSTPTPTQRTPPNLNFVNIVNFVHIIIFSK